VLKEGAAAGHTRGALYAAKGRLGIESVKEADKFAGQWAWRMPEAPSRLIVRTVADIGREEGRMEDDKCRMTNDKCPMTDAREPRRFEDTEGRNLSTDGHRWTQMADAR
jgi:hypothetical protein